MFKYTIILAAIAGSVFAATPAKQVDMQWVHVGNAGNAADGRGYGDVAYDYYIGKYEVTWTQYAAFLNAVAATDKYDLYHTSMGSMTFATHGGITRDGVSGSYTYSVKIAFTNRPVAFVSWYDAIRFANWMTGGATESGSYTITDGGADSGKVAIPDAAQRAAWAKGGKTHVLLPSEDEWYKAASHKNDGLTNNYWYYPNGSNKPPTATTPTLQSKESPGSANYDNTVKATTDVGAYSTASPYGTYDQGGNVWEWNEGLLSSDRTERVIRGGAFNSAVRAPNLRASYRNARKPSDGNGEFGFRVSSVGPAPTTRPK
jgi:formylglycine-generating enzyme required for sulfatase activity